MQFQCYDFVSTNQLMVGEMFGKSHGKNEWALTVRGVVLGAERRTGTFSAAIHDIRRFSTDLPLASCLIDYGAGKTLFFDLPPLLLAVVLEAPA